MSAIKNVAITGASGALGSPIFEKLVSSNKFDVTILRRAGSSSTFPSGTKVIDVDFASPEQLKAALTGQDAVVAVSASAPQALESQIPLIDAAVAAGVKRLIPSEFGSDMTNPLARKLPVFWSKVKVRDHLEKVVKESSLTFTSINNSAFLDWGIEHGFIFNVKEDGEVLIVDGGDLPFSATTLDTVAESVVQVLLHAEQTKNRTVYIEDVKITQNKLLELLKKAAPNRNIRVKHANLADLLPVANERMAKGIFDMESLSPSLWQSIVSPGYGGNFEKTDNELLGLKGLTEDDTLNIIKKYM